MGKRKSALPRRLDEAARRELNFGLSKDEIEQAKLEIPPPPAEERKEEQSVINTDKADNEEITRDKPTRTPLLDKLQERLEKFEESLEHDEYPKQRKKQKQAAPAPPSFFIPFNVAESNNNNNDVEKYVEIMDFNVECERSDEDFFKAIDNGKLPHFLTFFFIFLIFIYLFVKTLLISSIFFYSQKKEHTTFTHDLWPTLQPPAIS